MAPPSTVQPKLVGSDPVTAGKEQQVVFAGFTPKELVTCTLFSDPIALPNVRADDDGVVTVSFAVPKNLTPGTHLLQVVGQQSRTTGVAQFVVDAPVVPTTPSTTTSTTTSSKTATTTSSKPATTTSSSTPSVTTTASPTTTSSAAPSDTSGGGFPVWLWYVIGALVLAGVIVLTFFLSKRSARKDEPDVDRELELADAAAAERVRREDAAVQANAAAPTVLIPPVPGEQQPPPMPPGYHPDAHGLLSGQTEIVGPGTQPSQGPAGPAAPGSAAPGSAAPGSAAPGSAALPGSERTQVIGGGPTQVIPPAGSGDPTQRLRPPTDPGGIRPEQPPSSPQSPDDDPPPDPNAGRHRA